ncbi:F0F1 ATP synthase subunit epsilon [Marinicaulis flavus]|uniref:F0F1 ATP synthase subunit epsilon n=2 Tax=Hyphococcus luteus TaxID=2058213 RepID=A0A2S7KB84_9PROT|nr:F0F1 ATP synthase subunit epsilon [Marinicaulis flavus]
MQLLVTTPTDIVADERAGKIIAEATNGSFALLPRHVDFVAPLTAGVLAYQTMEGEERFLGVDEGFLVKMGGSVRVSTRNALREDTLERLQTRVHAEFEARSAREVAARSALARLETGLIRRFVELERQL